MTTAEAAATLARSLAERLYGIESLVCADAEAAIVESRAVALLLEELAEALEPSERRRRQDAKRAEGADDAREASEGSEKAGVDGGR